MLSWPRDGVLCRQCRHPCLPVDSGLRDRARSRRRSTATVLDMIEIPRDAPGSVACGRSGLPLLAVCPCGRRRLVPFRLLKTGPNDRTPVYGRPFKCRACGSREVHVVRDRKPGRARGGPTRAGGAATIAGADDARKLASIPLPVACFVEAARNARLDTPRRCSHAGKACPAA
jgi:hypothetical protein